MKPTTIDVQITKCPKQYEAVRIGMQATLDPEETVESAIKAATAQLNSLYVKMYQTKAETPQNAPQNAPKTAKTDTGDKREKLTFEDGRVQQIVSRIDKARGDADKVDEILKQVNKYYVLDVNSQKAIDVAAQIAKKI